MPRLEKRHLEIHCTAGNAVAQDRLTHCLVLLLKTLELLALNEVGAKGGDVLAEALRLRFELYQSFFHTFTQDLRSEPGSSDNTRRSSGTIAPALFLTGERATCVPDRRLFYFRLLIRGRLSQDYPFMILPRRFHLDYHLRFTAIEGEAGAARVGESLRSVCSDPVWEALHEGLKQILINRPTLSYEEDIAGIGRHRIELSSDLSGITVLFEPAVVFSSGEESPSDPFENALEMLCLLELETATLLRANSAWNRALGYASTGLVGCSLYDVSPDQDHLTITLALQQVARGETARFILPFLNASGGYNDLEWCILPANGAGPAYVAARNAPQKQTVELSIRRQAYHDDLTELPNRLAIEETIQRLIAGGTQGAFGILVLALDRFKWVNDALGREGGDQAIQILARRLAAALRAEDVVGRLQGDTFVAVLPGVANEQNANAVAQKALQAVQTPFLIKGIDVRLTASIGLVIAPFHGTEPKTLLERADTAMYQAKKASRGNVAMWRDGMALSAIERLVLESRLSRAVDRGEMLLHYQQQRSAQSGELVGFEALARWSHPERGLVPPDTFIPLAEDAGLIGSIGHWVLEEACRQGAQWNQAIAGLGSLGMSVNLSGRQFAQSDLVEQVQEILLATALNPERLDLEITETELMRQDEKHVRAILFKLRDMGIHLSLDDYGIGYTNWRRLSQLPVDRIKIDKSFVTQVCQSAADEAVIRAIVDLSHTLGMKVVAEGVETQEQQQKLITIGCDILQGFHYGRPVSALEALRFLPVSS